MFAGSIFIMKNRHTSTQNYNLLNFVFILNIQNLVDYDSLLRCTYFSCWKCFQLTAQFFFVFILNILSCERMCTILVNSLEDLACPVKAWLGKLTLLDMTPWGWLGIKPQHKHYSKYSDRYISKVYKPRSDCSKGSILVRAYTVCHSDTSPKFWYSEDFLTLVLLNKLKCHAHF